MLEDNKEVCLYEDDCLSN